MTYRWRDRLWGGLVRAGEVVPERGLDSRVADLLWRRALAALPPAAAPSRAFRPALRAAAAALLLSCLLGGEDPELLLEEVVSLIEAGAAPVSFDPFAGGRS